MSVTEIDLYRTHISRDVSCVMCGCEWEAVYPAYCAENIKLECPKCEHIGSQTMGPDTAMCKIRKGNVIYL